MKKKDAIATAVKLVQERQANEARANNVPEAIIEAYSVINYDSIYQEVRSAYSLFVDAGVIEEIITEKDIEDALEADLN